MESQEAGEATGLLGVRWVGPESPRRGGKIGARAPAWGKDPGRWEQEANGRSRAWGRLRRGRWVCAGPRSGAVVLGVAG